MLVRLALIVGMLSTSLILTDLSNELPFWATWGVIFGVTIWWVMFYVFINELIILGETDKKRARR